MGKLRLVGRVLSAAGTMQKTAKVEVIRFVKHPRVDKMVRHRKVFLAHDGTDTRMPGDVVRIEECRPLSKRKHFAIVDVLKTEQRLFNPITNRVETKYSPPS